MLQENNDLIQNIIADHYRQNGGLFGDKDLSAIQRELKLMHNIDIVDRVLDRRIKDYMGSLFSGSGGRAQ
jgi:hypothetical protein